MNRRDSLAAFHCSSRWSDAQRVPLTGDASLRRYERLLGGPSAALLVDAPPPEDAGLFVRMAEWLRQQGLVSPEIHAVDAANGFLIVQDFGDDLLVRLCERHPPQEQPLYLHAVDELLRLQRATVPIFLPAYDDAFFLFEIAIFAEWAAGDLPQTVRDDLTCRWRQVLPHARVGADVVVHRDFHALNLILAGDRLAVIDFQGARSGPAAYDLVSLLMDARRDVGEETMVAAARHFLNARPDLDPDAFKAACAIMAAQRSTKILGLFRRLEKRDGKDIYLRLLPRVRTQLEQALEHPALEAIQGWHERHGFGS